MNAATAGPKRHAMMPRLIVLLCLAAISLCACASAQAPDSGPQARHQIIVRFTGSIDDPAQTDFIRQLSEDAGATLRFERTLGTGAQLYSLDGAYDREDFAAILRRLELRRDILYAEEDRLVQPAVRH